MKLIKLLLSAAALILHGTLLAGVSVNADGWTVITPSSDSRIVYVSSAGNDSNNGLSASTPKATFAAGAALIRDGYPDHLLLRRGDTFSVGSGTVLSRWKSGRNATEPVVISHYGSSGARPIVKFGHKIIDHNGQARSHVAIMGVEFYKSTSDPASSDFNGTAGVEGFRLVGGGANILFEDCIFRFTSVAVQSYGSGGTYTNFKFRRNISLDSWAPNSFTSDAKAQGLFLDGVYGYVIEENFFDHNGWNETVPNAGANMYNHNVYLQYSNGAGGIIVGNIFARGASHGLQSRAGGVVSRNLFVLNAIGMNMGGIASPSDPNVLTFPNAIVDNVVLNGRKMHPTNSSAPRTTAVYGIEAIVSLIPNIFADDNIVANRLESGTNLSYTNVNMTNNISYKWQAALDTTNSSWPHPDDDLGDFYATIGGSNSTTAYLQHLRGRALGSLPWNMTAYAAINYLRAGFSRSAIAGVYAYPGAPSSGLPSPWVAADVGLVGVAGTSAHSSGTFTLQGSGAEIQFNEDAFRFVYQAASGDCSITARVTGLVNTHHWAKAGVMIRESLADGSRHASVLVSPNGSYTVGRYHRSTANTATVVATQSAPLPEWVRVTRVGNTFTFYVSTNGTSWTSIGNFNISMSSNVLIGLATCSRDNAVLTTGTFTNVTAVP
jgi:regulation of enolase protein 1 (concanavalin A-like superfamily)